MKKISAYAFALIMLTGGAALAQAMPDMSVNLLDSPAVAGVEARNGARQEHGAAPQVPTYSQAVPPKDTDAPDILKEAGYSPAKILGACIDNHVAGGSKYSSYDQGASVMRIFGEDCPNQFEAAAADCATGGKTIEDCRMDTAIAVGASIRAMGY